MTDSLPLVRQLERSAARNPDAEAIVHGTSRVSYGSLWLSVAAVGGFLRANGLQTGDRVALVMDNSPEYVSAYYGTWCAGGIAVALNSSARARELERWIAHCGATWLFIDASHPDFERLAAVDGRTVRIVAVGDRRELADHAWSEVTTAPPTFSGPQTEVAAIVYTSGTTGRPKGVTLTQSNFSSNAAAIIEYLQLRPSDRVLNLLPFYYSYGGSVLHTHLSVGAALVLENRLVYPQKIVSRMAEERVTGFPGVPSTFALLLQSGALERAALPALRYLTQAGGAMSPKHIVRVRELLPDAQLFVMYGQTEATARLTYLDPTKLSDKLGSVGVPIRNTSIEIHADDGRSLACGEAGEVCVRGPNIMAGYYDDAETTSQVMRDGWLRTGDIGYLDADGFLYLQGRRSDIIKSGAHRISPADIEEVIAALSEVAEVAVVGLPDEVLGESIKAVVALRQDATLDAMAVQRHCSHHLPRYKIPKNVEFVARLPRTASGKIMRYVLTGTQEHDHATHTS